MSKNYKWVNLTPDEIWEQTSPKVHKNKKKYNRKKKFKNKEDYGDIQERQ